MNTNCYLCLSDKYREVFNENGIPIVRCENCGHTYSTYEQEEHYAGYWDEGEDFDLDWWDLAHRPIYEQFSSTFIHKKEGRLLDVGCGLGFFVKHVRETFPGWEVKGYEMSPRAVKFAREKNGQDTVFEGMVQSSGIEKGSLDIITLWDVIEHIPRPQSLLNYLHSLLKPDGILFLQTPNFPIQLFKARLKVLLKGMREGVHYLEAKDHINNYTRESLSHLALQCGFKRPEFYVLKPILSVSGSKSSLGKLAKLSFYYITHFLWEASFHHINLNNTLFATIRRQ